LRNLNARPLSQSRSGDEEQIQQSHAGIVAENIRCTEDVSKELNGTSSESWHPDSIIGRKLISP
jgi:hypothetical protein